MKYKSPHVIAGPPSTAESPDVIAIRSLIDRIVAENGALLYDPTSKQETLLGQSPLREFAAILARKGVDPIVEGRVIVATAENQKKVLDTIQQLGLELQIIFNKGSLMVLPSGVNKASGLTAALDNFISRFAIPSGSATRRTIMHF